MRPSASEQHAVVTGGAGFIGSRLVGNLLHAGARVTVIDDLSTGVRNNLDAAFEMHGDRIRLIVADAAEATADVLSADPASHLYHLAAAVGVRRVVDDPVACIETNVHGSAAVFRAAAAQPTPPSVLLASSSEVYGKSADLPFREDGDLAFGPTTAPRWSYGMSKALDEHLLLASVAAGQLRGVVVRFFNTVGPGQRGEFGMVLPRFVRAALRGGPITVYGSGEQTRCFCDVRDVSAALPPLLDSHDANGAVVNLGSERVVTINHVAELVRSQCDVHVRIEHIPYDRAFGVGFEDLNHRRPDVSRARALIGFEPRYSLEQTITDVIAHERRTSALIDRVAPAIGAPPRAEDPR
jgi:UDP-glucose 4-epimerase